MLKRIISISILFFTLLMYPSFALANIDEINEIKIFKLLKEIQNENTFRRTQSQDEWTYTVKKGDNLYRIALNHQIDLDDLFKWNGLDSELIHPGDVLIVSEEGLNKTKPKIQSKKVAKSVKSNNENAQASNTNKEMTVIATAYTAYCNGCSGTTAYGIDLRANPNQKVIAVDPNVIPLGTKVWVEGYGVAIAGDTGGAIKGNKIDVFIPSHEDALDWGVKKVKVKILN